MGHENDFFFPEEIDVHIEQRLSARSPSTSGDHLLHDLQKLARSEQKLDGHSLASVWQRVQAKREHMAISDEHVSYISFQNQCQESEEEIIEIKEKAVMKNTPISREMNSLESLTKIKKRSPLLRLVGLSLVAAVALLTIVSFTIFSGVLRPVSQMAGKGSSTLPGVQSVPSQKAISNATLVCSVALDILRGPQIGAPITLVDWPTQGKIDALSSAYNFTTFSAHDCSQRNTKSIRVDEVWSPDGKKVMRIDSSSNSPMRVLDRNGNTITDISGRDLGATIGPMVWSSDSTKLIVLCRELNEQGSVKSVDAANGSIIKTLMKIPGNGSRATNISPGGRYIIVSQINTATKQKDHSIWDVNTGKKVSDLLADDGKENFGRTAFSPDSSLIAVGGNKVSIYSIADGKLVTSFEDHDAVAHDGGLAWSPDGKYLAESVNSINIYDVNAKKIVATFGKVNAQYMIIGLAWAPDGTGLVSSTDQVQDDGHSQTPVNVWSLSQGS